MIQDLIDRLMELRNLIGVEGDFLLPDEEIEMQGIKEILGDHGITYLACNE